MRIKIALVLAAALALTVPSAALAHKGDQGRKVIKHELRESAKDRVRHAIDHRLDRLWRGHRDHARHQTFKLGPEELLLTGHGKLGSRTVQQPANTATKFRAWRGVLKIWALSGDVVVECKGRGYKRTWTKRDGIAVTKCKGIGNATVTGSNFMVYFKARLGQAKFPADSTGLIHTWGRWFAGPEMDEDPDDVALDEKPASDGSADDKPSDASSDGSGDDKPNDKSTDALTPTDKAA